MLSQTKHNPTRTAFHFPHTVPIPYTLTASSVKASANKSFLYLTIVTIYSRQFTKYPAAGSIVTLFIFDDMTKNVQIAVSSLLQSTVRKPELMFIIKTE
jgi:hypothetical protein